MYACCKKATFPRKLNPRKFILSKYTRYTVLNESTVGADASVDACVKARCYVEAII